MTSMKLANSGDCSNLSLLKAGCVSRVSVSLDSGSLSCFRRSDMLHHLIFPGQFLVGQATANYLPHSGDEAVEIVRLPVVVAERLFIDVAKQVERFDGNVGTHQGPLQQCPKVFNSVRVDVLPHVFFRVGLTIS